MKPRFCYPIPKSQNPHFIIQQHPNLKTQILTLILSSNSTQIKYSQLCLYYPSLDLDNPPTLLDSSMDGFCGGFDQLVVAGQEEERDVESEDGRDSEEEEKKKKKKKRGGELFVCESEEKEEEEEEREGELSI